MCRVCTMHDACYCFTANGTVFRTRTFGKGRQVRLYTPWSPSSPSVRFIDFSSLNIAFRQSFLLFFFRDSPFHRNLDTANKYTHMHTQTSTHILDTVNCFPSWSRGRLRAKKMKTKQRSTTSMRSVIFIRCPVHATFVRTFLRFCDGVSSWWTKTYKSKCPRIDVLVYASVLRTVSEMYSYYMIIHLYCYISLPRARLCMSARERERENCGGLRVLYERHPSPPSIIGRLFHVESKRIQRRARAPPAHTDSQRGRSR